MKRPYRLFRLTTLALLLFGFSGEAAVGAEYYYALIFGSQSNPKRLRNTHTWATFVKAVGEGPDLNTYALEVNTISWLPATLDVKVLRPWPEEGVNLDLEQTIQTVHAHGETITMWGPFLIQQEVYERSLKVSSILASGEARYRAISGPANLLVSDCIHAVAAVDPKFGRGHYPLIRIGKPASRYIAHELRMRSIFDQTLFDNSWLIPRLGLNAYPIEVVPGPAISPEPCGLCRDHDD